MGVTHTPFLRPKMKKKSEKNHYFRASKFDSSLLTTKTPYIYTKRIILVPTDTGGPNEEIQAGFACFR